MEKKRKTLVVLLVILSLVVLGLGGYLIYDNFLRVVNDIEQEKENGNNAVAALTDENIIEELRSRLDSYGNNDVRIMLRSDNNIYYFTDTHMIIQAITQTDNSGNDNIPFEQIDNYIKRNFNVKEFKYNDFDYHCNEFGGYRFDAQRRAFTYCMTTPTGGFFNEVFRTFNINPLKFEQDNDYYYVHANIITSFQSGEEYFCADGEGREEVDVEIFDNLDFKDARFNNTISITCSNFSPYNEDRINNEFKELTNYNNILDNAPIYKFIFTKTGILVDRIEKI